MRGDKWTPPIVQTVASEGKGIAELAEAIAEYETYLKKENLALTHAAQHWQQRLVEMLRDAMLDRVRAQMTDGDLSRYAADVAEHKRDPYTLVEEIVAGVGEGWSLTFRIDHLGIAVKSLAAARVIYEKLGLKISPEEVVDAEQVRLVMVPVGESRLELLEPTSPDSTIAKFIAKRGEGLHHVCSARARPR